MMGKKFLKFFLVVLLFLGFVFKCPVGFCEEKSKWMVAVMPFDGTKEDAEEMTSKVEHWLLGTDLFRLVERKKIQNLLDELKMSAGGITESSKARELGKMLGVDYLVFGTVKATWGTKKEIVEEREKRTIKEKEATKEKEKEKERGTTKIEEKPVLTSLSSSVRLVKVETGEILSTLTKEKTDKEWVAKDTAYTFASVVLGRPIVLPFSQRLSKYGWTGIGGGVFIGLSLLPDSFYEDTLKKDDEKPTGSEIQTARIVSGLLGGICTTVFVFKVFISPDVYKPYGYLPLSQLRKRSSAKDLVRLDIIQLRF